MLPGAALPVAGASALSGMSASGAEVSRRTGPAAGKGHGKRPCSNTLQYRQKPRPSR